MEYGGFLKTLLLQSVSSTAASAVVTAVAFLEGGTAAAEALRKGPPGSTVRGPINSLHRRIR